MQHVFDFFVLLDARVKRADAQCDLESRRGLLTEDIEHLMLRERLRIARPAKFRALAATEFALAFAGDAHHLGLLRRAGLARGEQAVAFADEQVAHVQRDGGAVFLVQRLLAVAERVVVLDVIVDERGLVEALDGDGGFLDVLGQGLAGVAAQRLKRGHGEEGPPALAGAHEPVARDALGLALGVAHDGVQREGAEPEIHLVPERAEVEAARLVIAGQVDVIPHPVEVHSGVNAVVLKQRNGDAGNRGSFHVGERTFQHAEATHANDGLHLAGLNERHDDGGAFRHERRVTELLCLRLQILNRAEAALFAQQAELIEGRRALRLDAETLGQQQQPSLERHGGELLAPHLVVHEHADVVAVDGVALEHPDDAVGVDLQLGGGHGRHRVELRDVVADDVEEVIPLDGRLRDVLLRRAEALLDDVLGDRGGRVAARRFESDGLGHKDAALDVVARTFRSVNIAAAGKRVRGRAMSVESGFLFEARGFHDWSFPRP